MRSILFFVLLVIAFGCSKDDSNRPRGTTWGSFSASRNGVDWVQTYPGGYLTIRVVQNNAASVLPCTAEYYSLSLELFNSNGFSRELLSLTKVPLQKGKYKVITRIREHCSDADPIYGVFFTTIDDGDVLGDAYDILSTEDNFVQIDSYDTKSREIKGQFQLAFLLVNKGADHFLPDTLRYTNGLFHTKVLDK